MPMLPLLGWRDRGAERLSGSIGVTASSAPNSKGIAQVCPQGWRLAMTPPTVAARNSWGGGQAVGGCLTAPLPSRPPQSGQAYYINDGESVNIFEWMAPLVGTQTPLPQ